MSSATIATAVTDRPGRAVGEALLVRAAADRAGMSLDTRALVLEALYQEWCRDAAMAVEVAELMLDGVQAPSIIAGRLGLTTRQVRAAIRQLQRAACRLTPAA